MLCARSRLQHCLLPIGSRSCSILNHVPFLKHNSAPSADSSQAAPSEHSTAVLQQMADPLLQAVVADKAPVVFYHYPCADGVFAALAATLYFRSKGVQPRYVPHEVYRSVAIPDLQLQPQSVAFLLDYAGPDGFPQQLAQHVGAVVVLDHHKTAAAQLADTSSHPPNLHVHLDMQRSGAAIARDFFSPPGMSEQLQHMFGMVEDADLWRWALQDSKAFHAGLSARRLEYSSAANPGIWEELLALDPQAVVAEGHIVLQRQDQLIAEALEGAQQHQLGGAQGLTRGWGCCLGCRVAGELVQYRSQLGNRLAQRSAELGLSPVGLVAYHEVEMHNKGSHIKVSLRSTNGFDTSAVSEAFGGGGHAAASSCIITLQELTLGRPWRSSTGCSHLTCVVCSLLITSMDASVKSILAPTEHHCFKQQH
ncbi:hypothetical protein COO60DRAFT_230915 [Scenedesmus sp. NREL 46B-D3]|nr:hypothetical protein COO60DRAFT_230915 [Scenedesmus sp. NREL 46B-D3]